MSTSTQYVRFTQRSIPIPADYRPLYKIGHILLILSIASRGAKASLMKIHFLCWAIKSKRNMETVQGWVKNNFSSDFHIWGIEPTVNRALSIAVADGMIAENGGKFVIEEKGNSYVKMMLRDEGLYVEERKLLSALGKTVITESKIQELSQKLF